MTEIPISKWGNSSAIRLPKAVMNELGLKPGQSVQLTVKDGKGIIEPVRPQKITLGVDNCRDRSAWTGKRSGDGGVGT